MVVAHGSETRFDAHEEAHALDAERLVEAIGPRGEDELHRGRVVHSRSEADAERTGEQARIETLEVPAEHVADRALDEHVHLVPDRPTPRERAEDRALADEAAVE